MIAKTDWSDPVQRKAYFTEYRRTHRMQILQVQRRWNEAHSEHLKEYQRRYRQEHREHLIQLQREWRLRNKPQQ